MEEVSSGERENLACFLIGPLPGQSFCFLIHQNGSKQFHSPAASGAMICCTFKQGAKTNLPLLKKFFVRSLVMAVRKRTAKVTSIRVNGSGGGHRVPQNIETSSKSNQQDLLVV